MYKNRNAGGTSLFYQPAETITEIRSGYLYKSPPKRLTAEKSWKRRYFVLFKVSDQEHCLKYFKSEADRETLQKEIDLSQITLLYGSPEHHQKWDLIQRTMKCSPSCVLFIRTPNRDYFFVGADSDEVDGWFTDLFEALKNRPHTCMSFEEMLNKEQIVKTISKPNMRKKNPDTVREKKTHKSYSLCDLYPTDLGATGQAKYNSRRRASEPLNQYWQRSYLNQVGQQAKDLNQRSELEPMNPIYDYPRPYQNPVQMREKSSTYNHGEEPIYVDMVQGLGLIAGNHEAQAASHEAAEVTSDDLVTSVIQIFSKLTARVSPLPLYDEETDSEGRKKSPTSDRSSPPLDFSSHPSNHKGSTESLDPIVPQERDIEVKHADLKKHLTVTEVDGKPIVFGWTGQPQTVCLFHRGDQILAINDLHVSSVDEFNTYLSRSLKNEVKLTILRLPGRPHLHLSNIACTDC